MIKSLLVIFITITALTEGANVFQNNKYRDNGRIVGGNETTIEENPWQVSLQLFGLHSCGGSIVSPDTIVTAAHCIDGFMELFYEVVIGTTDLLKNSTRSKILNTTVHELWDGKDYDVAIIKLTENLTFSDQIQPIALPDGELEDGQIVRVTGWGLESEIGIIGPNILRSVDVQIINRENCSNAYAGEEKVTERMICAGVPEGGKDACQGDSGGPLSQNGILYGIVSWGLGCGEKQYPGVYTNVAEIVDWIKQRI